MTHELCSDDNQSHAEAREMAWGQASGTSPNRSIQAGYRAQCLPADGTRGGLRIFGGGGWGCGSVNKVLA